MVNIRPLHDEYSQGRLRDGSGSTQFCFDRFGNVVKKVTVVNGKTFTTSYVWNLAHRLTQETTPTGTVVTYTRDAIGRVVKVAYQLSGGASKPLVNAVTYAPFGPVTSIAYGNGRTLTRSYDADYVVSGVSDSGSGGLNLTFGRDAIGNLTQIASGATGNLLRYDPLNRLTSVTDLTNHPQWAFTCDATGNRLSAQAGTATPVPYTYPTTSHHLYAVGTTLRGYDASGNTTAIGSAQGFHYNDTGRMDQATDGAGHATMQYATNALGQRVEKYLTGNAAATQYAIRDEAGHLIGEYDGTSNRIREVLWMDGMPVGVLSGTTGSLSYLEPDQLGTPRVAIDGTTNTQTWNWNPLNDPFGQSQPTGTLNLDLRFPGQTYDPESGRSYNYFRDYEAGTGRYAQSDPIGLGGGVSTYAYVGGNPLAFSDPLGLEGHGPWSDYSKWYPQPDTTQLDAAMKRVRCLVQNDFTSAGGDSLGAFGKARKDKFFPAQFPGYTDQDLTSAEHYIMAYNFANGDGPVLPGGDWALLGYAAIPGYHLAKALGFYPHASSPSNEQDAAGFEGLADAINARNPGGGGAAPCGCHK